MLTGCVLWFSAMWRTMYVLRFELPSLHSPCYMTVTLARLARSKSNGLVRRCTPARALMGDVFDMARIEAGKLELEIAATPLREFLDEINDIAQALPHPDAVSLGLDLAPDLPDSIPLDDTRIRQVLFNLISNA